VKIKAWTVTVLIATHALVAAATYAVTVQTLIAPGTVTIIDDDPTTNFDKVLDGDTVVVDGEAIKIRGVDAPDLGPWARCWAEAIAARESMLTLENELRIHNYEVAGRMVDPHGKVSARFIQEGQFDISDPMKVYMAGAAVDGKWDWCGTTAKLTPGSEKPTPAPNLWWPSGEMYDPRAAD